jgi:hypothetical protein
MGVSHKVGRPHTKAVTIRVPADRLRKVMRARKAATQSELINDLLTEKEERLAAEEALRASTGMAGQRRPR